jgi:hypothetical protein
MKIKLLIVLQLISGACLCFSQTGKAEFQTRVTYKTAETRQGIAVDSGYFYSINSRGIGKYNKITGNQVITWNDTTGRIIHLDGGVILGDRLFCAHSNYPQIPMASSIEIFSAADLRHVDSYSFGNRYGSCTWADFYDNSWWICFAHYDQFRIDLNKGTEWTLLVRFDSYFVEKDSWTFPEKVISQVRPMSVSGGSWGPDGRLYIAGHDSAEIYILKLPQTGSVLEYVQEIKTDSRGQGIAWDRSKKNILYGIIRKDNSVVVSELVQRK